jgi:hypothetical protein
LEPSALSLIYFFYGLAFFSMGLLVAIEGGRAADRRLRMALRPLAGFGMVHAVHEWLEMFDHLGGLGRAMPLGVYSLIELSLLAFSFLSLAAFGGYLVLGTGSTWRVSLIIPLVLEALWAFGLLSFRGRFPLADLPVVASVWTRYTLAIPAGLLAALGLVVQQRAFRRAGLIRFGQDSLWAAVCFAWYSLVGQLFVPRSLLWPSTLLNERAFFAVSGFPIQALRAAAAIGAAVCDSLPGPSRWKAIGRLWNCRLPASRKRSSASLCAVSSFGGWWQPRRQSASVLPVIFMTKPARRLQRSAWACGGSPRALA